MDDSTLLVDSPQLTNEGDVATDGEAGNNNGQNESTAAAEPEKVVPEEYAEFTTEHEGLSFDPDLIGQYKPLAKELGLSQEQAQKLVDLYAKQSVAQQERFAAQVRETQQGWKTETLKILGPQPEQQLGIAKKAIDKFASPELRQLLHDTGLANHKDVVQHFIRLGQEIREDSFVEGTTPAGTKTLAETMYPNMTRR